MFPALEKLMRFWFQGRRGVSEVCFFLVGVLTLLVLGCCGCPGLRGFKRGVGIFVVVMGGLAVLLYVFCGYLF